MKTKLIAFIYFLLFLPACAYSIRYDGPYEGRVVDVETGKPIEGVVVLGVWYKETPTVAGAVSSYYDAKEAITDKNGEFQIQGLGLRIFSNVAPMNVLIFKAGYAYIGMGPWESFKLDGGLLDKKVNFEWNKAIIPLKKLTMEERMKQGSPDYPSKAPEEKIRLILREINEDRKERGLKPIN